MNNEVHTRRKMKERKRKGGEKENKQIKRR
jgi:hypothetical protein